MNALKIYSAEPIIYVWSKGKKCNRLFILELLNVSNTPSLGHSRFKKKKPVMRREYYFFILTLSFPPMY